MHPNTLDVETLKEFFKVNEGLTRAQMATLANRSVWTIKFWKHKCGFIKFDYSKKNKAPKLTPTTTINWDNKEWLEQAYEKMGIHEISKLVGENISKVYSRFKRYKIKPHRFSDKVMSTNPCHDEGWLNYYYAKRGEYLDWCKKQNLEPCPNGGQGLTAHECAELANVDMSIISEWLASFKMRIRDVSEANSGSTGQKRTIKELRIARDNFFELYRTGKITITLGSKRFSNGVRLDKAEVANKRFNTKIRGTPKRS